VRFRVRIKSQILLKSAYRGAPSIPIAPKENELVTSKNVFTKEDTVDEKEHFAEVLDNLADTFELLTCLLPDDSKAEMHVDFFNHLHDLISAGCALDFELGQKRFAAFFNSALKRVPARHKMSTDLG
jgi:hypothetical protein